MSDENTENPHPIADNGADSGPSNQPDYIAKQYRVIRTDNGWQERKERIGVAWKGDNGSICFRLAGIQHIERDVHLFPIDKNPPA